MLLSGFASPIENMPDWLQTADAGQPGSVLHGDRQGLFLKDMPDVIVIQNLWPMAIIGTVTLSSATWLFRHRGVNQRRAAAAGSRGSDLCRLGDLCRLAKRG